MLRRRTPQVLIGTAIIGLGATGLAAPAQASDFTVILTGNYSWVPGEGQDYWLLDDPPGGGLTVPFDTTGATMTFNAFGGFVKDGTRYAIVVISPQLSLNGASCASGCRPVWNESNTFDIAPGADSATVEVKAFGPASNLTPAQVYEGTSLLSFTVTNPTAPDPDPTPTPSVSAEPTATPAPHIQQFGVPKSGTCNEAASDDHNWAGVASGGWGESWAQWINDGDGGFVCTRTLVYNASQGAWEID